eukprot:6178019-Pleurochrysis_carterae.AAC.3
MDASNIEVDVLEDGTSILAGSTSGVHTKQVLHSTSQYTMGTVFMKEWRDISAHVKKRILQEMISNATMHEHGASHLSRTSDSIGQHTVMAVGGRPVPPPVAALLRH